MGPALNNAAAVRLQFVNDGLRAVASTGKQPPYQLAFRTPGIIPWSARLRKQIRHIPNFWYTARGRPHIRHRRTRRVEYLGGFTDLAIFDLLAILLVASG